MKLYATTTSERASKGQGGNEYIYIDLLVGDKQNQINAGRVSITHDKNRFLVQYHETLDGDGVELKNIVKGEKKKDEWCNKYHAKALPDEKGKCSLCGGDCA